MILVILEALVLDKLDSKETHRPAHLLHRQRLRHSHKQNLDVDKDTDHVVTLDI